MIRLLKVELFLIFRQKRTYYGLGAILIIEVFIMAGAWFQGTEIIDILLDNLNRSFYLQGNLLNGNLILYIVLNSLWFNFPLIIMIIVSGFLTNDFKDRTLHTIMLQSVSKRNYILAKYLAAITFTLITTIFLIATSGIMAYGIFGNGDLITYLNGLNFIDSTVAVERISYSFLSGTFLMFVYSIISITLAVIFKEITITWIACAFFLILTNLLLKMDFHGFNSWFLPKLIDTWQYFFYFEIPWRNITHNLLILAAYGIVTMLGGVFIFMKRDIG